MDWSGLPTESIKFQSYFMNADETLGQECRIWSENVSSCEKEITAQFVKGQG